MSEKYQARSNKDDVDEKKMQDERNIKNNANTINNIADVAIASKHPYAVAGGMAVKGLDKITNGKSTEMLSEGVTKSLKYNPMGKQIQQTSNVLAESGAGNAIGKTASLKSGTSSAMSSPSSNIGKDSNSTLKSGNGQSNTNNSNNNSSNFSNTDNSNNKSLLSDLGSDSIGKLLLKNVGKKYVIIGCVGLFIFLLLMTTIVGAKDYGNLDLTNNTSTIIGHGGARTCTVKELESNLVYVGDLRVIGMQGSLNNQNISFIAENSVGYDWLVSTGITQIDDQITNNSNSVIVLGLGINDLYNIDNYIAFYKEMIEKYPNTQFFFLSINPIDESLSLSNGYNVTNEEISMFNEKIKSNFNEKYIDTNSSLETFGTSDGINYDDNTNKNIHNSVIESINGSGCVSC